MKYIKLSLLFALASTVNLQAHLQMLPADRSDLNTNVDSTAFTFTPPASAASTAATSTVLSLIAQEQQLINNAYPEVAGLRAACQNLQQKISSSTTNNGAKNLPAGIMQGSAYKKLVAQKDAAQKKLNQAIASYKQAEKTIADATAQARMQVERITTLSEKEQDLVENNPYIKELTAQLRYKTGEYLNAYKSAKERLLKSSSTFKALEKRLKALRAAR